MKICLFGATGRVGSAILADAINCEQITEVTVLVRDALKLNNSSSKVSVITGDVTNLEAVKESLRNANAVVSALSTDGGTALSEGIKNILVAMNFYQISRLITIGTAGILNAQTEFGKLRYQTAESRNKKITATREHHVVYDLLAQSEVNWTLVCPTYLPVGEKLGQYRVQKDFLPKNGTKISIFDTADFAFQQLFSDQYLCTRVGITY